MVTLTALNVANEPIVREQSRPGRLFADTVPEEKSSLSFYVTSVWQQWEREADSDLQAQRYDTFDTVEELIRYLDREKRQEP